MEMDGRIPTGFCDLGEVLERKNQSLQVMGVVVDYMPPKPSRGTHWMSSFNIADLWSRSEGIRVRFFANQKDLPKIQGTGDVIHIKGVQVKSYMGADILLSNSRTTWTVFSLDSIPTKSENKKLNIDFITNGCRSDSPPSQLEMQYALDLCNSRDRSQFQRYDLSICDLGTPRFAAESKPRDKFSLLSGVCAATYYDVVGQVVKSITLGERQELHVTDYTTNSCFYDHKPDETSQVATNRDGDEYGYALTGARRRWQGPLGQRTIMVTLFPPHSEYAIRRVHEHDFVLLKNVHVKTSRDGVARLEGVLHEDQKFPERVNIRVVTAKTDDRVKKVLRRKKEYEKQTPTAGEWKEAQQEEDGEGVGGENKELDDKLIYRCITGKRERNPVGKNKRKRRQEPDGMSAELRVATNSRATAVEDNLKTTRYCQDTRATIREKYLEPNVHIKTQNSSQSTRPISSILNTDFTHAWQPFRRKSCTLPFQNVCSRATVRVIDFKPDKLEDFAVKRCVSQYEDLSDNDDDIDKDDLSIASRGDPYPETSQSQESESYDSDEESKARKTHQWSWRFALLLEDASTTAPKTEADQVVVYVTGQDAECLLNQSACNLRRRPNALIQLREKLFILWSDLEERKSNQEAEIESGGLPRVGNHNSLQNGRNKNGSLQLANALTANDSRGGSSEKVLTKAFTCCLKEYGVRINGKWQRRFRMFGTTIH